MYFVDMYFLVDGKREIWQPFLLKKGIRNERMSACLDASNQHIHTVINTMHFRA